MKGPAKNTMETEVEIMSFEDITIVRQYNIIDGEVQTDRYGSGPLAGVLAIPGVSLAQLTVHNQKWVETIPGGVINCCEEPPATTVGNVVVDTVVETTRSGFQSAKQICQELVSPTRINIMLVLGNSRHSSKSHRWTTHCTEIPWSGLVASGSVSGDNTGFNVEAVNKAGGFTPTV